MASGRKNCPETKEERNEAEEKMERLSQVCEWNSDLTTQ
jgi:hypothetical protein